jgi:hypothetical protein
LEGDLLVGLAVGAPMTSLWKTVKRHGHLLHGVCELVVELVIFEMEEKLAIRERLLSFVELAWRIRRAFVAFGIPSW